MNAARLSERIDVVNDNFTNRVKSRLLPRLSDLPTADLEWLVREHYQFSFTNVELLTVARDSTAALSNKGVTIELQRNINEEDGHAPMYRQGMLEAGTSVDDRVEFAPTTTFLNQVRELSGPDPSRALGTLYATETAAIFEHQVFFEICRQICDRRDYPYQGSLIKKFHDIHLDEGVEQGHKDGLAAFVDLAEPAEQATDGVAVDSAAVLEGAYAAIEAMVVWWDALLAEVAHRSQLAL